MNKFTSLLIGCSLALAGAALAQQPDTQQSPSPTNNNKRGGEKTHGAEPQPGANGATQHRELKKEHGAAQGQEGEKSQPTLRSEGAAQAGAPTATPAPGGKHQGERPRDGQNGRGSKESTANAIPPTAASATAVPAVTAAPQQNRQANLAGRGGKMKADPQQIQQIKAQHTNFHAQPKPEAAPAVTFNANFRIEGSDRWQGPQYEVFRSYHPERHDQGWYHSHFRRVELIGGGYYYWNNGYWYPAWGYDHSAEYYAYDGPIYVGQRAEPPDQVIADVQAELQSMGYYQGEVDGLLGPLTREALTAYQADEGLMSTAAIDEPTLDSLGMG